MTDLEKVLCVVENDSIPAAAFTKDTENYISWPTVQKIRDKVKDLDNEADKLAVLSEKRYSTIQTFVAFYDHLVKMGVNPQEKIKIKTVLTND